MRGNQPFPRIKQKSAALRTLVEMQRAKQQNRYQRDNADRYHKQDKMPHDLILLITRHIPTISIRLLLARLHILPERRRLLEDRARLLIILALHLLVVVRVAVIPTRPLLLAHSLASIAR